MDYMDTLKRGWQLTWENKWLWILGFLAALGGGSSLSSNSNYQFESGDLGGATPNISPDMFAALAGGALVLLCVAFVVGILLWLVSLAAKGGLITGVSDLDHGQPTRFGQAFRQGWRKLLPLIGMTLLLYSVVIILAIVLGVASAGTIAGAIAAGTSADSDALMGILGTAGFLFLCLLCLLVPLGIVLSLIYPFAYRGIMLRNLGVVDSIRHGWRVLRDNLGQILLLGLVFFVIGLIVGAIAIGIVGLLGLGTGLLGILMSGGQPTTTQIVAGITGFLVIAIIFAIVSAVITAWRSATFTLAYEQWTGKQALKDSAAPLPPSPMVS